MNKIVVVFGLCALAASVHASQIKWGASSGDSVDATKITSGTMYLAYAAGAIDWTKLDNQTSFSWATLENAGFTQKIDSFAYTTANYYTQNTSITPATAGGLSGSQTVYEILIGDTKGDMQYLAYSDAQQITIAAVSGQLQTKCVSSFSYKSAEAVPEPFSGSLALLGVGLVALRRRMKKQKKA